MPQDLQSLMLQKALMQGQGQQPDLPETLSPDQGAQQAQAPLAGLRKPFESGMDALLSAIGVRGQRPGNLPTAIGSAIGAAGMAPGLLPGLGLATEAEHDVSPLLQKIFAENPAARPAYERAMQAQMPDFRAQLDAGHSAKAAQLGQANEAMQGVLSGIPKAIQTDTGHATAIPKQLGVTTPHLGNSQTRLQKSGLTEDMVRDIRALGPDQATKKYPQMNPNTIHDIYRGGSYGWVK